jgi:cob(I)alamin adenosyltransferase
MRINRVYTRTGDAGTTRLVGGREVAKDAPRIEAYGTIDELNSLLGVVRAELARSAMPEQLRGLLDGRLEAIQHDLFELGTDLATPVEDRWETMRPIEAADVARLEAEIDAMNDELPVLKEFILPGGGAVASQLQLARTVCRRAERRGFTLASAEEVNPLALRYLNRLSDHLFVAARWSAKELGEPEPLWNRR